MIRGIVCLIFIFGSCLKLQNEVDDFKFSDKIEYALPNSISYGVIISDENFNDGRFSIRLNQFNPKVDEEDIYEVFFNQLQLMNVDSFFKFIDEPAFIRDNGIKRVLFEDALFKKCFMSYLVLQPRLYNYSFLLNEQFLLEKKVVAVVRNDREEDDRNWISFINTVSNNYKKKLGLNKSCCIIL